jgi:hypothetical protein
MGLIAKASLQAITDRIGKRYLLMLDAATQGAQIGSNGIFYDNCHVDVSGGDQQIEIPTLSLAYTSDQGWQNTAASITAAADAAIGSIATSYGIIGGISSHFSRAGLTGSWNQYMSTVSGSVSESYRKVHSKAGGATMMAKYVFYDLPTDWDFGTGLQSGGTLVFTAGDSMGTQTGNADGTRFKACQLRLLTLTNIGGTDLDLVITGLNANGASTPINATIPNGTLAGVYTDVGTSDDTFYSITGVAFGTNHGTSGDSFQITNKVERTVTL